MNETISSDLSKNNKGGSLKCRYNVFSRLFICWVWPVLRDGNKRNLEEIDLVGTSKEYHSKALGEQLERSWLEEIKRASASSRKPSLRRTLFRTYWLSYMPGCLLVLGHAAIRTMQPLLFMRLLSYWSVDSTMSQSEAGIQALMMIALNFIGILCQHHNNFFMGGFGMKIRIACSSLLYRKLLRMSQASLGDVAAGKLVNILSNDVARFDVSFMFLHYIWLIPLQAGFVFYFMYSAAGLAPFVGIFAVLILILPIQAGLTKLTMKFRREAAPKSDVRIKIMTEIISGIQVIKTYAWEVPFEKMMKAARSNEMSILKKAVSIQSTFGGFMLFTERVSLFITIATLLLNGSAVSAKVVYPIQQYFNIIQSNWALYLPISIASFCEMLVALERIQQLLLMDESDTTHVYHHNLTQTQYKATSEIPKSNLGALYVTLKNVSASWKRAIDLNHKTLSDISFHVPEGRLYAVIGPIGSGKTSLLQVILKELPALSGTVQVSGRISYSAQESWLFPDTVRENILFGLPFDPKKFDEVCRVCCLLPDFDQFPSGDLSLVGEHGVLLSGGQRTRINLARAVYREADIYVLDDPLSSVDANVGRSLFEDCIDGYLRGRTRILVTHQTHFLKAADCIIVLNDGCIQISGTYDELSKDEKGTLLIAGLSNPSNPRSLDKYMFEKSKQKTESIKSVHNNSIKILNTQKELQAMESRAQGHLKWDVINKYLSTAESRIVGFFAVLALIITQIAATAIDYWLSFWTSQVDQGWLVNQVQGPDEVIRPLRDWIFLVIHGGLVTVVVVVSSLWIWGFVTHTIQASTKLYEIMFAKLIRTAMTFFHHNPSGHILNRFSKDVGTMDEMLPRSTLQMIHVYLAMASILFLNAVSLPWTLIPSFVLILIFFAVLKWYLNAAQAVKRLEATTKSPVFSKISTTHTGVATIRSFDAQERMINSFDESQDVHTSAFYTFLGISNAFGLYLDFMCLLYLGAVMGIFILIDVESTIPVGSVGLVVSQSLVLTMMLQFSAKFTADVLAQMTAVERILEYTNLQEEEYFLKGPTSTPKMWPLAGQVTFQNVCLTYKHGEPFVLKNVNFIIKGGWKVGIVGRTGAGKSSLISALFRLSDAEGNIKIDGVDIRRVAKQDLRSRISIIPQHPVLFSGSVRCNLDPSDMYSDEVIWKSLEQVGLKGAVQALDIKISEGGSNFSVGQRQLLCLARALLRSNKIIILDEATANVDSQTDSLIQETIRREFASCTVITIAHRLHTVMDSDRILVMNQGAVVEFDHPHTLLNNPESHLNFLANETGDEIRQRFLEIARTKYLNDNHALDKEP